MYTRYKINKVIANEQGFKFSLPLRKNREDEFFIDGYGSIDGDDDEFGELVVNAEMVVILQEAKRKNKKTRMMNTR